MTKHKIIVLSIVSAKEFVRVASHCDFDIDIANSSSQSYTVDAKSILGVLGLDLGSPLIVSFSGCNDEFENFLQDCSHAA